MEMATKYLATCCRVIHFSRRVSFLYLADVLKKSEQVIEEVDEAYISRILPKNENIQLSGALFQLLVALGLLYLGSERMVHSISTLSQNINPLGMAYVLRTRIPWYSLIFGLFFFILYTVLVFIFQF
jgi:hypothetical protein